MLEVADGVVDCKALVETIVLLIVVAPVGKTTDVEMVVDLFSASPSILTGVFPATCSINKGKLTAISSPS